jgi:hypothetical protein
MFNNFFLPENSAVYGVMWENIVYPGRPHMPKYYGACAYSCRITKATDTHSLYVIHFAFPRQWSRERASIF